MFNYYFDVDREGHCDTVKLFETIGTGLHEGYASEYVMAELKRAPEPKRSDMLTLVEKYGIRVIAPGLDAVHLAERYIKNGIIPNAYRFDGVHIAAASIYGLDCVVSYNFKHINRAKTRILTAAVNHEEGYNSVVICTAKEVLDDEQEDV